MNSATAALPLITSLATPLQGKRIAPSANSGALGPQARTVRWAFEGETPEKEQLPTVNSLERAAFDLKWFFSQFSMHLDSSWRSSLFKQLDQVLDEESWEKGDVLPDKNGWRTLLRLLIYYKFKLRPGLGFNDSFPLVVWTKEDVRITLECRPNDKVHWIASRKIGESVDVAAGETHIRVLRDYLTPFNIDGWLIDADDQRG